MSDDVLHVIAPAPAGGAESVVLALAAGLGTRGRRTAIAAIVDDESPHPFVDECRARGLTTHTVSAGHRRYLAQAQAIAGVARREGSRVIHTHGFHSDVLGAWGAQLARLPVVTTLHGFTGGGIRSVIYDLPLRLVHRNAAAIIAVSAAIATRLAARGVRPHRMHHIPNAWAPSTPSLTRDAARVALGIDDDAPRLGWVGRLSHEKGADLMVEAMAQLGSRETRLSVLGSGPEDDALRAQAAARGVASQIGWHGMIRNASGYFAAFDALILSSRTEGTPMVLLEAMASGLPIIATSVGGVPEMLGDDEALLVPSERPDLLARAIRAFLDDRQAARVRAEAAAARFKREYDFENWITRHERLYDAVMTA